MTHGMGRRLSQAPVFFALVQVRFNPIMALDSYAPKIQDELRRQGYPDSQQGLFATFNLNLAQAAQQGPPHVPVAQIARYSFSNMEKTAGFLLDQGAFSFQATEYDKFETFAGEFLKGLQIVHEIVKLSYSEQIGIRYLDAIYPREGEKLDQYLNPSLLGLHDKLKGTLLHTFTETRVNTDAVFVIARTVIHDGPVGFPPDFQPVGVEIAERFRSKTGIHAILDTDGAHQRREAFAIDQIEGRLIDVHLAVDEAFKATVTKRAFEIWA
jgi:uncharacterized protein (TIGR04255 family)